MIINGTALDLSADRTWNVGTVTNFSAGDLSPLFTTAEATTTTTPALTFTAVSQAANLVYASPTASAGVPTFRTLVAADIPNLDASKITTGFLPIARGGTNASATPTAGAVAYGTGSAYAFSAAGTIGQVLSSNAAGAPTWADPTSAFVFENGLTATAPNIVRLGGSLTGATTVTQAAHTLAFTSTAVNGFSVDGTTFSVDALNNRVGIGNAEPTQLLDVNGKTVIRGGGTQYSTTGTQLLFGFANTTNYQHAIRTRHNSLQKARNAIDFFVWDHDVDEADAEPTKRVMTIDGAVNGRVGIGIQDPLSKLDVFEASPTAQTNISRFAAPTMTTGQALYLKLGRDEALNNMVDILYNHQANGSGSNYLGFGFYGTALRMVVQANGNVGIGADNPQEKLHVDGSARVSSLAGSGLRPVFSDNDGKLVSSSASTTIPRNCWEHKLLNPLAPSGTFTIDPDGPGPLASISCYCDMVTDGGGWTLILNYLHRGGTNPALVVLTNRLPIQTSTTLSTDESSVTAAWGHAGNAYLSNFVMRELRFTGRTSGHLRVIDFVYFAGGMNYARTGGAIGGGSTSNLFVNINQIYGSRLLPAHTAAQIPYGTNEWFSGQGNFALTAFPFYRSGSHHWAVRGGGTRWEVDDFPNNASRDTWHQVWIR